MKRLVVESLRADTVESRHLVSLAVVREDGMLTHAAGDPELVTYMRSAAKPLQAIPLIEDGAAARFQVTAEELALVCASHSSEADQVRRVRALLERIGLSESDLACGPHRPLWRDFARLSPADRPDGVPRTPLSSNCSGKHVAMLALAKHNGWPTEGYHEAGHPVQQRMRETILEFSGLAPERLATGIDGCGVVTFALPLVNMAQAWIRLVTANQPATRAIVDAMKRHPGLVAGRGRLCTELMRGYPELLAKVGAEGVYAAVRIDGSWALALKVEDGNSQAAMVALVAVLDQLGEQPPPSRTLPHFGQWSITNTRGERVGVMRATGQLAAL